MVYNCLISLFLRRRCLCSCQQQLSVEILSAFLGESCCWFQWCSFFKVLVLGDLKNLFYEKRLNYLDKCSREPTEADHEALAQLTNYRKEKMKNYEARFSQIISGWLRKLKEKFNVTTLTQNGTKKTILSTTYMDMTALAWSRSMALL